MLNGIQIGAYFIGNTVLDEIDVVGDSVCDFSGAKTIKEGDILTKNGLKVLPVISPIRRGVNYSRIRRLMRSPLTIQQTFAT